MLQEVAKRTKKSLREGDSVGRIGGDEFAIIVGGISDIEDTVQVVQKLFEIIAEPMFILENEIHITPLCQQSCRVI